MLARLTLQTADRATGLRFRCGLVVAVTGLCVAAAADDPGPSPPSVRTEQAKLTEQHQLQEGAAQQGLALSEDHYFTSTSSTIHQYDMAWNHLASREIRLDGVNHLGAIHHHDGFLWVGLLHGPENGQYDKQLDRSIIAKIRASDLSVVQTWDITKDVTWIDPVCFDGKSLWVGDLSDQGIHRYELQNDELVRVGIFRYPAPMHFSQGIRIVGNKLYTIHTFGEMDGLFEFDIPKELTEKVNFPTRVWEIQETHMHLEGFDFVPGTKDQIWHAQGRWVDRYVLDGLNP